MPRSGRRTELIVAGTAIALAALFTILVLLGWDGSFGTLPPPPVFRGLQAVTIYPWVKLAALGGLIVACAIAVFKRRFVLHTIVLGGTAAIYLPLWAFITWRIDRVRQRVEEPLPSLRFLVAMVLLTVVLHGILIAVARTPHMRGIARASAVVTCGVLLNLFWLFVFIPVIDEWWPEDWRQTDRLQPMRACRGAVLWDVDARPVGQIDDLWLQFRDPRAGGPVRAISLIGRFEEAYRWLSLDEARALRVRSDDPALENCDGVWRRDPVAPAPWHKIGWPEPGGRHRG